MEMKYKARSNDELFPLMGMTDGVLISKRGEITVGWELELPTAYSITESEYDEMITSMSSAIKLLPAWTMVHRQDIYSGEEYKALDKQGFLAGAYERHFSGRKYLSHRSYLFLTMSVKTSAMKSVASCGLLGARLQAKKSPVESIELLNSKASEFIAVLCGNGRISARRLTDEDLATENNHGLIPEYLTLWSKDGIISDFPMNGECVEIGDKRVWAYTLSESDNFPTSVNSTRRVEQLSTGESELFLSFAAAIGPRLRCEHIVNQYILTAPQIEILSELNARRKRMESMSKRSAENRINAQEIMTFIDDAHSESLTSVYTHTNILVWGREEEKLRLRGKVSAALAGMGVTCVQDTYDTPILWYSAIPGAACEIGFENLMSAELMSILCMGIYETYDNGLPEGMLKMCDRTRNVPITLDIQGKALDAGLIDNYNAFILGGSGTGKSFFTNYFVRSCYDAGETVFIIDIGDSYEGLCSVIREESGGKDGHYYTWDVEKPISFDAFVGYKEWIDASGKLRQDNNSLNFLLSFIQTLWQPSGGWAADMVPILRQMVRDFIISRRDSEDKPIFDDFRCYVHDAVAPQILGESGYTCGDVIVDKHRFDINGFLIAMGEYALGGPFGFLLNDRNPRDLFGSRFTVFEVDKISSIDDKKFYPLCILCIMNAFDNKMRNSPGFKVMVIEEAWKAIANETMAPYLTGLWKTARKYQTSAVVVTQQISDVVSSSIVRDSIVANSSIRALLEHTGGQSSFRQISDLLGLGKRQQNLVLSINKDRNPDYMLYREVFISLGDKMCGVYAHEVSPEEAIGYESNKEKKRPLLSLAPSLGVIGAIKRLVKQRG